MNLNKIVLALSFAAATTVAFADALADTPPNLFTCFAPTEEQGRAENAERCDANAAYQRAAAHFSKRCASIDGKLSSTSAQPLVCNGPSAAAINERCASIDGKPSSTSAQTLVCNAPDGQAVTFISFNKYQVFDLAVWGDSSLLLGGVQAGAVMDFIEDECFLAGGVPGFEDGKRGERMNCQFKDHSVLGYVKYDGTRFELTSTSNRSE